MKRAAIAALAAILAASCASVQSTLDYPATWPDADVRVGVHQYALWFHPERRSVLLRRGPPARLGMALAEAWTVYAADASEPAIVWTTAADAVLQQLGCHAIDISGQDQIREVAFTCVEGVNVMQEVGARRTTWQAGVSVPDPLRPA